VASGKQLGRLIKNARDRLNLSQQELADLTGWSRPFISMLEIGTASERNLENTVQKLAEVLREDEDRLRQAAGLAPLQAKRRHVLIPNDWDEVDLERLRLFMKFIDYEKRAKKEG